MTGQAKANKWLWLCALAALVAACSTTTTTTGFANIYSVPRVQELAVIQEMSANEATAFRSESESITKVALGEELYAAYWADELETDYAILKKRGRKWELVKVKRIGTARVEEFSGERNGKPFSGTRIY